MTGSPAFLVELGAVGAFQAADVARKLDRRHLHPEAKAEERHLMFAREASGFDFSFHAALAEPSGNEHAGDVLQLAIHSVLQRLGVDQFQIDPAILARGRVGERFVDAFVGVLQLDVFPDDRDLDLLFRAHDALDEFPPIAQVRRRRFQMEKLADQFVESFLVQHQRHFVDRVLHVARLDHGPGRDVAKHGKLLARLEVERLLGATQEHLRLQADLAQLRDALLGRLGLQFARRLDVGHERGVHVDHVLRAGFEDELPDRFEERQALDVAGGAADFRDQNVGLALRRNLADAILDLVRDVRNHLHRLAEIIAAPLLQDARSRKPGRWSDCCGGRERNW